jgi:hypothetical protein
MSIFAKEYIWTVTSAVAAIIVLILYVWVEFIAPRIRRHQLKRPCNAYFNIQPLRMGDIGYAVQDDEGHQVRELVLASNSTAEIEIGYRPVVSFREEKLVFGCEGDEDQKPVVVEYFNRLVGVGKSRWAPGEDGHMRDRHGFYHMDRGLPRSPELHCIVGFKLQTRQPGTYPVCVSFVTPEGVGSARLIIRVEDKPRTRMRCIVKEHEQRGCLVSPAARSDLPE